MSGWVEALPLILVCHTLDISHEKRLMSAVIRKQCSHDENFAWLNRKDDGSSAIVLANPKTLEYQIVRTSLLPGLLKTVRENRKHSLPLRLFEVSDVAIKAPEEERKAKNIRKVAAVFVGRKAGFEVVHGLLDRIMLVLGVKRLTKDSKGDASGYYILGEDGLFHSLVFCRS